MPSKTIAVPAAVEPTDVGDIDDKNGAVAETIKMAFDHIHVVIDKAGCIAPEDEDNETRNNNFEVSNIVESSGMGRPDRELDVTTEWAMFPAPALYDDDDGGRSHLMLDQGPWFDSLVLEEGSIVGLYVCDGWLLGSIRLD